MICYFFYIFFLICVKSRYFFNNDKENNFYNYTQKEIFSDFDCSLLNFKESKYVNIFDLEKHISTLITFSQKKEYQYINLPDDIIKNKIGDDDDFALLFWHAVKCFKNKLVVNINNKLRSLKKSTFYLVNGFYSNKTRYSMFRKTRNIWNMLIFDNKIYFFDALGSHILSKNFNYRIIDNYYFFIDIIMPTIRFL